MRAKAARSRPELCCRRPISFRECQSTAKRTCIVVPRIVLENRAVSCLLGYFESKQQLLQPTVRAFTMLPSGPGADCIAAASGLDCHRLRQDAKRISYSNTLGWNTFPVPTLTEKNKADLTRCAEDILLAREHHFPATIADLYDPDNMPDDLRPAHERNDEVLERIYIGRRFKNDTERLEKLFDLYTKMTASAGPARKRKAETRA